MEEFLSEFLNVYTCGAYGSCNNDPATASVEATDTAAAASTTTSAKNDGGDAMEEFISEFVSFYSLNVGLPTLPPPQSSAENNEAPTTTTTATNGQVAAKDEEEGAVEEFLREFIAFYSMGTIGTTDPTTTSTANNTTMNNEPSIEKAKAYYPASSPSKDNPGKSTSEEEGMMKEFLREFVAFYTLQGDEVAPAGETPTFAPAVSPEEENAAAAADNSPAVAESRNDTPTVDNDDDTEDEDEEEEGDDTNVIEAVANNNADNGLPFPLNTMENKVALSPTASSSSSTKKQKKKKSSRSFVTKKMKKLFGSRKKNGRASSPSAQAVQ